MPSSGCLANYKLSQVYKISNIVSPGSETLDSFLSKLSSLIGITKDKISVIDTSSSTFDYFFYDVKRISTEWNFKANITFVFYAETDAMVLENDLRVKKILNNQTIWPSATVQICNGENSTLCKSSKEIIGPSNSSHASHYSSHSSRSFPSLPSSTNLQVSSSSSLFSLITLALAFLVGSLLAAL